MKDLNSEYPKEAGCLFFLKGYLSQWYKIRMFDGSNGVEYNCCEQYMMAEKALLFRDRAAFEKILQTSDPSEQKELGRQVKNFDQKIWSENCKLIVYRGNLLKFSQNSYLKKCLFETKGYLLVECNPTDPVWAIGMSLDDRDKWDKTKWKGTNFLGEVLTKVREDLRTYQEICR